MIESRKFTREGREWEIPDAFYRVSIKVIIKDGHDRLLVVQDTTDGSWEIPGGGLDNGETIEQAAKREIREELGVELVKFSDEPVAMTLGLHPNNYMTLMLYYQGALSGHDFAPESKFKSQFVVKEEFLNLKMMADELPIKQHTDKIWP
ncbi:MAG TPA: NUDIX hydrolase [Candidatus Saccharimonadales bacterium]|nr:NUDIX hydrolase [Candidatus Saccharimonadales bacterium]